MKRIHYFFLFIFCGVFYFYSASFFYSARETAFLPTSELLAQSNTYFQPKLSPDDQSQTVRVQILIRDSPDPAGLQILSVSFNGQKIPLQPRDIYGNRGSGSFEVQPGKYKLKWTLNRSKRVWPRRVTHEEIVHVNPRDLWLQIQITGEQAEIL